MQPSQTAIKLSLNKTVVTVLTKENMMNYHGKNGENIAHATKTIPDTETCVMCNSLVPDGCGTGTTGIISW